MQVAGFRDNSLLLNFFFLFFFFLVMQNTASIESINTSHPFFHQLSAGNRHCVGGWEAGEVEADVHWCGGDGEKGARGREVRELKCSK